jgi:hypothetical protein
VPQRVEASPRAPAKKTDDDAAGDEEPYRSSNTVIGDEGEEREDNSNYKHRTCISVEK